MPYSHHSQAVPPLSISARRGNTLMEYGVCGAVVAVVAASMLIAGTHMNDWMALLRGNVQQQVQHTAQTVQDTSEARASYTLALKSRAGGSVPAPLPTVGLSEQGLLQPVNLSAKVQTLGANGTTELMAGQIQLAADKLAKANSITPAQYNQLLQLANQGHKIADIESILEKAMVDSNGKIYKLDDSTYTYQGQQYSIEDLFQSIGFSGTSEIPRNLGNFNQVMDSNPGRDIESFLKTYSELKSSGVLNQPEIKAIVDQAVNSITTIGETTQHEFHNSYDNWEIISPNDLTQSVTEKVSQTTNTDSANICNAGNGQDGGNSCSAGAAAVARVAAPAVQIMTVVKQDD